MIGAPPRHSLRLVLGERLVRLLTRVHDGRLIPRASLFDDAVTKLAGPATHLPLSPTRPRASLVRPLRVVVHAGAAG